MATNRKFWFVAMTNGYQMENLVDEHLFFCQICSLLWVLGGLNEKFWPKKSFDQLEWLVGSRNNGYQSKVPLNRGY